MDWCSAIKNRRLVSFTYDGHPRVVEPAAYGDHVSTGNRVLRAHQVRGTSSTRSVPLWDLFLADKIIDAVELDEHFVENPPGYQRGDKHMGIILCEL